MKTLLEERGLKGPTRLVELNLTIPLLEEASLVDAETLQDRWAALSANAADADQPEVRHAYATILAELTSFDASILEKYVMLIVHMCRLIKCHMLYNGHIACPMRP